MKLNIKFMMLGDFHITVNGKLHDEKLRKSKKGSNLLQYLILKRGETVSCDELYKALWKNNDIGNPENALKTLVSRTRVLLSEIDESLSSIIATSKGSYYFEKPENSSVDVYRFESLYNELNLVKKLNKDNTAKFEEFQTLYLENHNCSRDCKPDIMSVFITIHDKYMKIVKLYISLLKQDNDYKSIIKIARLALDVDAFEEDLHLALMDAFVQCGYNSESIAQYKHVSHMYFHYLGAKPPEGLQKYYDKLIENDDELDMDMDSIKRELSDSGFEEKGGLVCEYAIFKDIYNLQLRSYERQNIDIYIAIVKLESTDGRKLDNLVLSDSMNLLNTILKNSLRKADIITQINPAQYALLLSNINFETGKTVMERIRKSFYQEQPNANIFLTYKLSPIKNEDNK